ncbi:hypothetical protein [Ferrimonas aestuarii]|uniref:Uncharacterized protein n=1 Tax=Ferrimonas aestuarii TaxID=2569539 RepID=A0A4U1BR17_9GAMM|nr:hypothetical protein [Ferrimonas aestuarii]TKB57541.1 hypothetical protein FCL42_04520 [Ferrimonas aestuarii]
MVIPGFEGNETTEFSLIRLSVSFALKPADVPPMERLLEQYMDSAISDSNVMSCQYVAPEMQLELSFFGAEQSTVKQELARLHKVVQTLLVPTPVFTVSVQKE